ncbi:asparagine synthase (glutamine-hydrolyzing) [Shinella yambaruensis]|uniref:asparagine synthase (glutamine-hydrolyzing) n=1 Tax=Shinella yambaruensis TaxID=415996 RepID=A0ABQ5ZUL4_9HYPH|nr:asparagine synthase (glutamine-hydrolyzing) [Shinella yambaruensis]MCJ8025067.1 asparagine synthase (glutamine-hydrolyzing) [Shinella yambaruensis]MCU7979520.1 asparagine synthase (glutamine-hydrolyzing) [Shinella yambaruensis]GLR54384.1 asparagine synthetase B [Shinella yambaruensis]
MCGIAGYCGGNIAPERAADHLRRMVDALRHRGPDGEGILVRGDAGLAHTRLSIVGLADGAQPMATADGALALTFNGEIFNYVELRNDLAARGHRFRTTSDTEVLLAAFTEKGAACLTDFNGDFAFALHDARNRRLVLARDRMGVRPLFYTQHEGALFFASEIGALLALPGMVAEIDPVALDQIFTLWCPIPPRTAYRNIFELPAGHLMTVEDGRRTVRPWWQLSFPDRGDAEPAGRFESRVEELRALLADATRLRLRADVPVGAYLSGGIDSSIIAALAARTVTRGLRTFSLTFRSEEHDESAWQRQMAATLDAQADSVECTTEAIARHLPAVMGHIERPILRTAPVPLHLLAGRVRARGMKVVLTGEGADEIFAGYDLFREARVRRFCGRQPGSARRPRLFQRLYPYLPGLKQQTPEYLARFFAFGSETLDDPLYSHRPRFRSTAAAKLFFCAGLKEALGDYDAAEDLAAQLPADFRRWHPLHQAQYLETAFLLPGYILSSQGDRVMMANAVEGRFPFLDHRVVSFAAGLAPDAKLLGLREKHVLKEAARGLVPAAIIERPKQPYRAPDSESFAAPQTPAYLDTVLSPDRLAGSGLFNVQAVDKLKEKVIRGQVSGFRDNAAFIGILSTQLLRGTGAARSTEPASSIGIS